MSLEWKQDSYNSELWYLKYSNQHHAWNPKEKTMWVYLTLNALWAPMVYIHSLEAFEAHLLEQTL